MPNKAITVPRRKAVYVQEATRNFQLDKHHHHCRGAEREEKFVVGRKQSRFNDNFNYDFRAQLLAVQFKLDLNPVLRDTVVCRLQKHAAADEMR